VFNIVSHNWTVDVKKKHQLTSPDYNEKVWHCSKDVGFVACSYELMREALGQLKNTDPGISCGRMV